MGSRKKTQTVGYRYGLTVHMGVCYGPVDSVVNILADDRVAYTDAINTSQTVNINQPSLFGGDEKEGGLNGRMHVQMGDSNQNPSPLLTAQLGSNIPAFRGILGFVYKGIMSANNPYLKPFSFIVRRVVQGWQGGAAWYQGYALINGRDMNPAHIVYECLTNQDWGMGYPTSAIDDSNFKEAANKLYAEGFGLSLMWTQQNSIESFLRIIFDHIAGALSIDPKTGLYQMKLIRQDYSINDLPIFDPSNISELTSYQRAGWGELVNELTLKYTDPVSFNETAVTVQNLASIQAQGGVINQTLTFSGINNANIAQRVAQRELIARSTPLAKVSLSVNRHAWKLMPGDVFKLAWPKLGITGVIMRVVNVATGTLDSGMITVDAVEDVFGMPDNVYSNQEGSGWVDPLQSPAPAPARMFTEINYYDLVTTLSPADLSYIDADDGYPVMYASSPSVAAFDYKLLIAAAGSSVFKEVDQQEHCPIGVILAALPVEEFSTIEINSNQSDQIVIGEYAIINNEYVRINSFNNTTNEVTIARGVIDTVPQPHAANSIIYFAEDHGASDSSAWPNGASVKAKVITRTGMGELDPAITPIDTITITARHSRPFPPGKFRINNEYMPESVEGDIGISWVQRNRLIQDSNLVTQTEAGITPEAGQTCTIKIYDQNDVLCRTLTGFTANSYIYPINEELADCGGMQTHLRVELLSERDGVESWQAHSHRFERIYSGYGFNYGIDWGNA